MLVCRKILPPFVGAGVLDRPVVVCSREVQEAITKSKSRHHGSCTKFGFAHLENTEYFTEKHSCLPGLILTQWSRSVLNTTKNQEIEYAFGLRRERQKSLRPNQKLATCWPLS